jgi:hypothetical protein
MGVENRLDVAVGAVRDWVEAKKERVKFPPNRRQILGKKRELKLTAYLDFYRGVGGNGREIDPRRIAAEAPLEVLLHGDLENYPYLAPIRGGRCKLSPGLSAEITRASQDPDHAVVIPTPFPLGLREPDPIEDIPF